jgi:phosphate transport system substrate-binding protein
MTKVKRSGAVLAVLVLALGAAIAGTSKASTGRSTGTLKGAGSTFVAPLIAQWQANYKASDIQYNPIGSGGGIAAITSRTVDFGASDAPLSKNQFTACKGCVQIPWGLSATAILYNIPGLNGRLHLNAGVIADIYLGKITNWNSPRVKALNRKLNLPDLKITPVYRSDNSGTSYNFTDYLSHASGEWKTKVGIGVNANWPAGIGGKGSSGVSAAVTQTKGGIGYADVAYALKNHLAFAAIQNKSGKWTLPGLRGIKSAASLIKKVPANNELSIVNPPKAAKYKNAYPICTFTYAIIPINASNAQELKRFVSWALTNGQQYGPRLFFVPIPKVVLTASTKTLSRVHT